MAGGIVIAATLDEAGTTMVGTAIGVAPDGWRRYPISVVTVSPDFREAARWFTDHAARDFAGGFGLHVAGRRAALLVDVSHRLYGMPFAEAVWGSQGRRKWQPEFGAVVEVEADIVVPQRDDRVRVKIGRGAMVSALAQATRTGRLRFGRGESDLLSEWNSYNRSVGAGDRQAPPRVQALKLAAWGAARMQSSMEANLPRADKV
jgi:hypothetical protein